MTPRDRVFQLAASPPSADTWGRLAAEAHELSTADVAAVDAALRSWPDSLRRAPAAWVDPSDPSFAPAALRLARRLEITDGALSDADVRALAANGRLDRLRVLRVAGGGLSPASVAALVAVPDLQELALSGGSVDDAGLAALVDAGHPTLHTLSLADNGFVGAPLHRLSAERFPALVRLDLSGNDLERDGTAALAGSSVLARLSSLVLSRCGIGPDALERARLVDLGGLERLVLALNPLGDAGARVLAGMQLRPEVLGLSEDEIGPAGVHALVASGVLARVVELSLAYDDLGPEGAAALVAWPSETLGTLDLAGCAIGNQAAFDLVERGRFPALRTLDLRDNGIDDQGLQRIVESDGFARLFRLRVGNNPMSAPAWSTADPKLDLEVAPLT